MTQVRTLLLFAALALALAPACGRDRSGGRETSARDVPAPDSTLFGDDRARQGDTARTIADVAVLERLIDEYEGLDVVMDELAGPTSGSPVQGRAWKGDRHEDAAKARLLELLRAEFGERYHPRTPEGVARTSDSIASLPREAGTRALDSLVLDHHRRVAVEIESALPRLGNPRVREALADLAESLDREIRKLARDREPSGAG